MNGYQSLQLMRASTDQSNSATIMHGGRFYIMTPIHLHVHGRMWRLILHADNLDVLKVVSDDSVS